MVQAIYGDQTSILMLYMAQFKNPSVLKGYGSLGFQNLQTYVAPT